MVSQKQRRESVPRATKGVNKVDFRNQEGIILSLGKSNYSGLETGCLGAACTMRVRE